jgi:hypothetical protein
MSRVDAYRLAKEVREELFQGKTSTSSLLRKSRTIANLLKREDQRTRRPTHTRIGYYLD